MGLDPLLYPNIPGPVQNVMQRQSSLDARIAALERRRDLIVTPVSDVAANGASFGGAGGSMEFEWYGGRLWMILGGRFYTNASYIEGTFTLPVKVNGTQLVPAPVQGWARPGQGGAFGLAAYSDVPNLTRGTNTLTAAVSPAAQTSVDRAFLDGLILEWPVA